MKCGNMLQMLFAERRTKDDDILLISSTQGCGYDHTDHIQHFENISSMRKHRQIQKRRYNNTAQPCRRRSKPQRFFPTVMSMLLAAVAEVL